MGGPPHGSNGSLPHIGVVSPVVPSQDSGLASGMELSLTGHSVSTVVPGNSMHTHRGGLAVGPLKGPQEHCAWSLERPWEIDMPTSLEPTTIAAVHLRQKWGSETNVKRLKRLRWLLRVAESHKDQQARWTKHLHPQIATVSGNKRVPFMRTVCEALGYDEMGAFDMWERGVSAVGRQPHSEGWCLPSA